MGLFSRLRGKPGTAEQRAQLERLVTIGTNLQAGVRLQEIVEWMRTQHGVRSMTAQDIFRTVEQVFQQALELARSIGDRRTEAETLYNLARLYQDPPRKTVLATGDLTWDETEAMLPSPGSGAAAPPQHAVALRLYQQALELAGREHMETLHTCCLLNIAVSRRPLGDMAQHAGYVSRSEAGVGSIDDAAMRRQVEGLLRQERLLVR